MKNNKLISNLLFCLTIASLPIAFSITCIVGEVDIFGIGGIIRYSWIMLLSVPVGLLSLLVGLRLKKEGKYYKKLLIVAGICIPLMVIMGSYRVIFRDISFNTSDVHTVEEKINFALPDNIKVAKHDYGGYDISYIKILDKNEADDFVKEISKNACWTSKLSHANKGLLPFEIQAELSLFDYFLFYDLTTGKYNVCPDTDEYRCVFVAYDCELQRIIILDDYTSNDR